MKEILCFLPCHEQLIRHACALSFCGIAIAAPAAAQSTDHGAVHGAVPNQSVSTAPAISTLSSSRPPSGKPPVVDKAADTKNATETPSMRYMPSGEMPAKSGPANDVPAQASRKAPDLAPTRQYFRNADGSIPMPGEAEAVLDDEVFAMVLFDELEYAKGRDARGLGWQVQAWIGRDYNKLWLKSEGDRQNGRSAGNIEALWSHAFAAFWDWQVGVRHDFGASPSRQWMALAVQGTAPYWFDVAASAYIGPNGRTAARFKSDYTFRLSQTTLLSPEVEVNAYRKADPARGIGSGLSDVSVGLRLRHEIRREIQPYIGVTWSRKLGSSADLARAAEKDVTERSIVAGVRIWY